MDTFEFGWPSLQTTWIVLNTQPTNQFITRIIKFLDPENIAVDTKIISLTALESKIWLLLYFGDHLGSHIGFDSKTSYSMNKIIICLDFLTLKTPLDTNIIFLTALERVNTFISLVCNPVE